MAKSLKKMEETLETVLKSISQPPTADEAAAPAPVSRTVSPLSTLTLALEGVSDMNGLPEHPMARERDRSASTAESSGVRFESGLGRQGMQWGARKGSDLSPRDGNDSPRLHSLPDNTLNPYALPFSSSYSYADTSFAGLVYSQSSYSSKVDGQFADSHFRRASLQNTRKRALPSPLSNDPLRPSSHHESDDEEDEEGVKKKKTKLGVANTGYFQVSPADSFLFDLIADVMIRQPAPMNSEICWSGSFVSLLILFD